MWHVALYFGSLMAVSIYSLARGGLPERMAACIMLAGTGLTIAAQAHWLEGDFSSAEIGVMTIDAGALVATFLIAMFSSRFWPLWLCALMIVQLMSHLPTLAGLKIPPFAYAVVLALWGYPMLLIIAVGTRRHQQRLREGGADPF